jgi:hypothetical protein
MKLSPAPIRTVLLQNMTRMSHSWESWFNQIYRMFNESIELQKPIVLARYTVATVPDATVYTGGTIYVSNESGGAVMAFSDGTNWRRVTDRQIIT